METRKENIESIARIGLITIKITEKIMIAFGLWKNLMIIFIIIKKVSLKLYYY